MELKVIDIFTKNSRKLLSFEWDIISAARSENGRYASVVVNRDASAELHVVDLCNEKMPNSE